MKTLAFALLLGCVASAHAQTAGENLRVHLLTFGPGDAVWERFGHNAIAVTDVTTGESVAYNWGMFSFDQPGFVPRLMQGRMIYWMEGFETGAFIDAYVRQNRSVYAQELNLAPAERAAMRDFLAWHSQEANKYYRYDYYRDNCSTRVRDAIDRATGGGLRRALAPLRAGSTYRSHTAALTYDDVPTYTGLMLAMGPRIDRPLSAWEEAFIPMELREWVRGARVRAADGSERPLVVSERTIFDARRAPIPDRAPARTLPFTTAGSLVGLVILGLAAMARRTAARGWRVALAIAVAGLSLVIGFFGTLISLLWAFTDHAVTYGNENVLQANPLSLVLAVLGFAALVGGAWARRWAAWMGLFVAGLSALGFVVQALPRLDQVNGDVIGLLLPIHAAIGWVLWRRWQINLREPAATTPIASP